MPDFVVRPLSEGEVEQLGRLADEIWHAHYPGIISREQIDFMLGQRYSPAAIRASMPGRFWDVAWMGNQMVGFAHSFADAAAATWKLDKLYVHPEHQRRGIGQALLLQAIKHATNAGATRLVLRVNKHNAAALAAYAKYGFKIYGQHVLDIGNGFVMDDYLLEMNLCS
jgi:ribosomal protein S18 acetylase RimI-like enzyme